MYTQINSELQIPRSGFLTLNQILCYNGYTCIHIQEKHIIPPLCDLVFLKSKNETRLLVYIADQKSKDGSKNTNSGTFIMTTSTF